MLTVIYSRTDPPQDTTYHPKWPKICIIKMSTRIVWLSLQRIILRVINIFKIAKQIVKRYRHDVVVGAKRCEYLMQYVAPHMMPHISYHITYQPHRVFHWYLYWYLYGYCYRYYQYHLTCVPYTASDMYEVCDMQYGFVVLFCLIFYASYTITYKLHPISPSPY